MAPFLLSIITPIHDGAADFAETAASVPNDCATLEWIIVHDGVKTAEQIRSECDLPPFARILPGDNAGATAAVNKGVEEATGRYLLFLMGDDLLIPDGIRHVLDILESDPEAEMITGPVDFFTGTPGPFLETATSPPTLDWSRILYGRPCLGAHLIRADNFVKLGHFNPNYTYCSDREFLGRMFMTGMREFAIDAPIYRYRIHPESETMGDDASRIARYLRQHVRLAAAWRDQCIDRPHDFARFREWHAYETARLVVYLFRNGTVLSAIACIMRSTMLTPFWPVRAFQARRIARAMAKGDLLLGP